ncbi:hypothetical protein D6D15_08300 [Aureobasidium pullulans]|uniref:Glutathione S-transferase n=1 Tax=Aureobasidium pullulans TaxID=5580 RepID=A0A4S9AYZ2_AURPU|nr:hypothetical protein D6D15_08300 [Aureobasidium pullulans]
MATEAPKVTLYWLDKSRAQRFIWLLEECNVDYNIEIFKRTPEMLAPPELKKVHPLGKSPVVGITAPGRTNPLILAESGFITEYLTEHFAPHLAPKRYEDGKEGPGLETEEWIRYHFFLHYAEGSLMALMVTNLIFSFLKGDKIPFYIRPITNQIVGRVDNMYFKPNFKTHFDFLESQLASAPNGGGFLCGNTLTAADILMSFPLQAGQKRLKIINATDYPKLNDFVNKLDNMEGYKKSIERIEKESGDGYDLI